MAPRTPNRSQRPTPDRAPDPELRSIVHDVLVQAGTVALRSFGRVHARLKPDGTEVTDADREAESVLIEALARAFPDDGIVGEEGTSRPSTTGATWFVDPIDGTSAYLEGLAHWGPTICLLRGGTLVVGGLWLPRINEFWYAQRDAGAWRDGTRLRPSDSGSPGRHHSLYLPSRYHRRMPIPWPGKVRALGSSAVHLAMVAAGGGAATVIPTWELWDIGCGALLVQEAGRRIVTWSGEPVDPAATARVPFLAGTPAAIEHLTRAASPG